jgi:hypothetical protein
MKKQIILIATLALMIGGVACKKKYTTDNVTVKTVAPHYPTIVLNGDQFISVPVGTGEYTDAGAKGIDDNDNKEYTLVPELAEVDLTTPGFYTVIYKFKNTDGYESDATRFVLVTNVSDALDYTGPYARTTNGQVMNVSKVAKGLYKTDNVGGVPGNAAFIFDVYFGQIDDSTLSVPVQPTPLGNLNCVTAKIRPEFPAAGNTQIEWAVRNPSFGTALRRFIK